MGEFITQHDSTMSRFSGRELRYGHLPESPFVYISPPILQEGVPTQINMPGPVPELKSVITQTIEQAFTPETPSPIQTFLIPGEDLADPSILTPDKSPDGKAWVYATQALPFSRQGNIQRWSSEDFKVWQQHYDAFNPLRVDPTEQAWAPNAFVDKQTGKLRVAYTVYKEGKGAAVGITEGTDDPAELMRKPKEYLLNGGAYWSGLDPHIIQDESGDNLLAVGGSDQGPIKLYHLNDSMTQIVGEGKAIAYPDRSKPYRGWIEGAAITKRNGLYLLNISGDNCWWNYANLTLGAEKIDGDYRELNEIFGPNYTGEGITWGSNGEYAQPGQIEEFEDSFGRTYWIGAGIKYGDEKKPRTNNPGLPCYVRNVLITQVDYQKGYPQMVPHVKQIHPQFTKIA